MSVTNDKISISGNFDGGNPKDPKCIIQTKHNSYTIIPYSEDNDPNYKFRLDVKVKNNSKETKKLELFIDWREPKYNNLRDYVYAGYRGDADWEFCKMAVENAGTRGLIKIKPGVTHLCMHPKYNFKDYHKLLDSIAENDGIKKIKIGKTADSREMDMIKISSYAKKPKKKILMVSRIHPYETVGSFCAEGIVEYFLKAQNAAIKKILKKREIYLIPMANPDGVYHGLCKMSAPNGIDLSKRISENDPTSQLLKRAIDQVEPDIYCEFHNWMLHEYDGIYFLNWLQAKRFVANLHSRMIFNKKWKIHLRRKVLAVRHHGFKKYCREKFGSICLCLEFPWRDRKIADIKRIGIDSLIALTKL